MGAYDLGELGPATAVAAGLQGLLEAYKMKMGQDVEYAKMRQSAFNTNAADQTNPIALANLKLRMAAFDERKRATANREEQGSTAINPITGETTSVPKGARFVTPPGAVDAQKNIRTAENLLNILDMQERKMGELPKGRAYGRAAVLANKLTGYRPDVGVFQGIHEATIPVFSRVVGGDVGNLAEQEQARAAKINPSLIQTPEEMKGVINFTRDVLKNKLEYNRQMIRGGMYGGRNLAIDTAPEADAFDEFGEP